MKIFPFDNLFSFTVDGEFCGIQSYTHEVDFENRINCSVLIETEAQQEKDIHSNKNIETSSKNCYHVLNENDDLKQLSCKISEDLIFDSHEESVLYNTFSDICMSITVADEMNSCSKSDQPRTISVLLTSCHK